MTLRLSPSPGGRANARAGALARARHTRAGSADRLERRVLACARRSGPHAASSPSPKTSWARTLALQPLLARSSY
jgi:hypothetical protein